MALATNLAAAGLSPAMPAPAALGSLAVAGAGMWLGQILRTRLRPPLFRFWFFVGLFAIGLYLSLIAVL